MKDGLYQFVPHSRIAEFEANGWRVEDWLSDTNHGQFSVLMYKDAAIDSPDENKQSD